MIMCYNVIEVMKMDRTKELLKEHTEKIYKYAIGECMPNRSVEKALKDLEMPKGRLIAVSIGKAGWEMANTAYSILGEKIHKGIVITKYEHSKGKIGDFEIYEASHPVVDCEGVRATKRVLEITSDLSCDDTVLFLVSGGGSALFEDVSCPLEKMQDLTRELLRCGADINEINAIRKHISNVKGGKFAKHVYPAKVFAVALSDVIGNDLSTIASGPATQDTTTVQDCLDILEKYKISPDSEVLELISRETPKEITNAHHIVSGSVTELCKYCEEMAASLGYHAQVIDDGVCQKAHRMANAFGMMARSDYKTKIPLAYIFGGEVTVLVKGNGKGGRNQELALLSAREIEGLYNVAVFCVGSDGTDGPTEMAGGYVDGGSWREIFDKGVNPEKSLENNDAYNALKVCGGLVYTGPTGTNVNDMYVMLIQPIKR